MTAKVRSFRDDKTYENLSKEVFSIPEENEFRYKNKTASRRMYELQEFALQEIVRQKEALLPEKAKKHQSEKKN